MSRLTATDSIFMAAFPKGTLIEARQTAIQSKSFVDLGIVCPMANEAASVELFIQEVLHYCTGFKSIHFFVIVDRASVDNTYEILLTLAQKNPQILPVWAPDNTCVVDAYIRGYQEALKAECDWILEIDAGFSHQPADIPKFFDQMLLGYDCVFGSRFCKLGKITKSSIRRYLISFIGGILVNLVLGTSLSDMTGGFELFSHDALQSVLDRGIQSRGHFFQSEIKAYLKGFRASEVPIHYRAASPSVNSRVIKDALSNLLHLFRMRMEGKL